MDNIKLLAEKLGISTHFSDAGKNRKEYDVSEKLLVFMAEKMGYKASTPEEIESSIEAVDKRRWQQSLEKIYVVEQGDVRFDLVVPADYASEDFALNLTSKYCTVPEPMSFEVINDEEYRLIGKTKYVRLKFVITSELEIGYYDVDLQVGFKHYKTTLAVAPKHCWQNEALKHRLWGYAIQLYSLKSDRNWGVGDFTDLANFVKLSAQSGADIIGINPLNVLSHDYPENASPYQSISRIYLNPIYIDVEKVPEYQAQDKEEYAEDIEEFRQSELIQYEHIYPIKISFLQKCYDRLLQNKSSERYKEFENYMAKEGAELERLAVFQSLYHKYTNQVWGGWRAWPEEYQTPNSLAVKEYAKEQQYEVNFFKFLQFEANRQLEEVVQLVKDSKMKIGLYRDLAVGVGQDSAEVWSEPDLFFKEAGAGAPPDAFFPAGQRWNLGAFKPQALKEDAYRPFIKILRANMSSAGALRIDHVMSLMRLFILPEKMDEGTYVYYNFKDMLNIVALESCLNKCAIVGESIGNVPDGFLDSLAEKNIYSLSVLWAERYDCGWGDFKQPQAYPENAFVSVGTHDMPPLRMWWFGYDIELSYQLGLIENEHLRNEEYKKRENDRWHLLKALDEAKVWPADNLRKADYIYGENYPEGMEEAVHKFVAKTNCPVFLAQLEDILHVEKQQNLPGTDRDLHPNWRRKIPVTLEKLAQDIAYIRNVDAITSER